MNLEEVGCLTCRDQLGGYVAIQVKDDRDSDQCGGTDIELMDVVKWHIDALTPTHQYIQSITRLVDNFVRAQ